MKNAPLLSYSFLVLKGHSPTSSVRKQRLSANLALPAFTVLPEAAKDLNVRGDPFARSGPSGPPLVPSERMGTARVRPEP